jgi:RNA polymerase sigma-70 factor (ECF subfamily)
MMANSPEHTTAFLITRARAGDPDAWEAVIGPLLRSLRRFAEHRLPVEARAVVTADDLVQDVLINGFRRLHCFDFRRRGALLAYLRKAIRNRIVDELRRIRRGPTFVALTDHLGAARSPLHQLLHRENFERFSAAMARLDRRNRQLIVLRFGGRLGLEEIAARLGIPTVSAARMAVRRAIFRLAREVNQPMS